MESTHAKQVNLLSISREKERMTVMLCIIADDHKLPLIVFKRKTFPKEGVTPRGNHIAVEEKE